MAVQTNARRLKFREEPGDKVFRGLTLGASVFVILLLAGFISC